MNRIQQGEVSCSTLLSRTLFQHLQYAWQSGRRDFFRERELVFSGVDHMEMFHTKVADGDVLHFLFNT